MADTSETGPATEPPPTIGGGGGTIHAGCVLVGEAGVLIRGASGAGKSSLARDLVEAARREGLFARLVSDDRTRISARAGRLIARPVAAIAGAMEIRGVGLVAAPFEPGAVVRLVVELAPEEPSRMPAPDDQAINLCGVMVPRLRQRTGAWSPGVVLSRLSCADEPFMTLS